MKKIIFAIAIVLTMGFSAGAQQNDAYFTDWGGNGLRVDDPNNDLSLPIVGLITGGSFGSDYDAPVGSGLIILGALGAGYALRKKRD